jgi:hypothetical protein
MSYILRCRTVTVKHIADRIFRARGFDPEAVPMTPRESAESADAINRWLRRAWDAAPWPQLTVCERRSFRAPWRAEYGYAEGEEVWHAGGYWRCYESCAGQPPAPGSGFWGAADLGARFIQLSSPWDALDIDESGFDPGAFAYLDCPLGDPAARAVPCSQFGDCIVMPPGASFPDGRPWCLFRPAPPRLTMAGWDGALLYRAGDAAYRAATGECYIALRPNDGRQPEQSPEDWAPAGIPEMFEEYVVLASVADLQADDEGKHKTRALAEEELDRVVHSKNSLSGRAPRARAGARR